MIEILDILITNNITIPVCIFKFVIINYTKNYNFIKTLVYKYNFDIDGIKYLMDNPIIGLVYSLYMIDDVNILNMLDYYINNDKIDNIIDDTIFDKYILLSIKHYYGYYKNEKHSQLHYGIINFFGKYSSNITFNDDSIKDFVKCVTNGYHINTILKEYNNNTNNLIKHLVYRNKTKLSVVKWYVKRINMTIRHPAIPRILDRCAYQYPYIFKYLIENKVFNITEYIYHRNYSLPLINILINNNCPITKINTFNRLLKYNDINIVKKIITNFNDINIITAKILIKYCDTEILNLVSLKCDIKVGPLRFKWCLSDLIGTFGISNH